MFVPRQQLGNRCTSLFRAQSVRLVTLSKKPGLCQTFKDLRPLSRTTGRLKTVTLCVVRTTHALLRAVRRHRTALQSEGSGFKPRSEYPLFWPRSLWFSYIPPGNPKLASYLNQTTATDFQILYQAFFTRWKRTPYVQTTSGLPSVASYRTGN